MCIILMTIASELNPEGECPTQVASLRFKQYPLK
jgi:hypothetical protein